MFRKSNLWPVIYRIGAKGKEAQARIAARALNRMYKIQKSASIHWNHLVQCRVIVET